MSTQVAIKHRIPNELYREIFRNIKAKRDLYMLMQVSKAMFPAAQLWLYHDVSVDIYDKDRTLNMCASFRDAKISQLVREITVLGGETVEDEEAAECWDALAESLGKLTRLRVLEIADGMDMPGSRILKGCNSQLTKFHCGFTLDDNLRRFLNTQKNLRDLYLFDTERGWVDKNAMPTLNKLQCHGLLAAQIVPKRPVRRVCLECCAEWAWGEIIPQLGQSATPIQSFYADDDATVTVEVLELLAEHLPDLQLVGECQFTQPEEPDFLFFIKQMQNLRTILINARDIPDRSVLVGKIHHLCPKVDTIGFRCPREKFWYDGKVKEWISENRYEDYRVTWRNDMDDSTCQRLIQ